MYDPIDRHDSDVIKLRQENRRLRKRLKRYEKFDKDDNINVIDGHVCYRDVIESQVTTLDYDARISGIIVYKDIFSHELIAVRHVDDIIVDFLKNLR